MQQQKSPSTPAAKQSEYSDEQVDEYRTVLVDHDDWYDCVYQDFKERMTAIGIDVDNIYFSGFWSQGDGACFEGRIEDWGKYLAHLGYDDPILITAAEDNWTYYWSHSGHYYHHKSVSYDEGLFSVENPHTSGYYGGVDIPDDEQFRGAVWEAAMSKYDVLALDAQIREDLEDHMKDLYRQLEQEYDYLTSDEAIIEWMEANEIEPEQTDKE